MSRPNSFIVLGFLAVLLVGYGLITVGRGELLLGRHAGDTLHLLEILFRMEAGERPHLDFMTPIGVMAFVPFVAILDNGLGAAQAILWGQLLVGLCFAPAAWWVGISRLSGLWPYLFGLIIVVLSVALVHGEAQGNISISMHYNRWAWAAAFVAIATAVLAPKYRANVWADGWLIGAACSFLALSKVTYFAAFFPPILLALLLRREWRVIAIAGAVGMASILMVTVVFGIGFWGAYVQDMLTVARSEVRPQPGEPFSVVLAAPKYVGGTFLALIAAVVLRQGGRQTEGLVLLTLLPGFFYVTYQNFGNDPQWLMLLPVLLFAALPEEGVVNGWGWNMRLAAQMTGVAAIAMSLPSFLNMAHSPIHHFGADPSDYSVLLPDNSRHADIKLTTLQSYTMDGRVPLDRPDGGLSAFADLAERKETGIFKGETLPQCLLTMGMTGWYRNVAKELTEQGYSGKRIMIADLFSSIWMFGDFERLIGGAPWYYGGLPGFESADYVLVPLCALAPDVRKQIVETIAQEGAILSEVYRSEAFVLLEKQD